MSEPQDHDRSLQYAAATADAAATLRPQQQQQQQQSQSQPENERKEAADAVAASSSLAVEIPLEPLFTLLTNTTTGSTMHPRVQYLFSDDDASMLCTTGQDAEQRAVVVDLHPSPDNTRWCVSWASSLSPDFALTGSNITTRQQHADDDDDDDRHATLRLEGVERESLPDIDAASGGGSLRSSASGASAEREDVDALADDFRRRMGVLRKVVAEGEKRRRQRLKEAAATAAAAQDHTQEKEQELGQDQQRQSSSPGGVTVLQDEASTGGVQNSAVEG
ncbi:hypothetical protein AAL_05538 [Moelleriella libera RCEF 2490]|uniref:Uncharacterized protein n=1 Tax=Moelleriella libera RCEF 2490 TaxID=1081109 RepID=A0A168AEA5_9HYPO|nr:hypothetical protein AAL_05538 [Moelleriella libera RCEF 2490]